MSNAVLEMFGVSAEKLTPQAQKFPKEVAGRVAHIDADFMAYQVASESKEELDPENLKPRKTVEEMKHNAKEAADYIRRMAGAERAVLHVTQSESKGGRYDLAIQKEYQSSRKDRELPEHLDTIRSWLGRGFDDSYDLFDGMSHTDQEADDGMAQAHYADPVNTIICSKDKDLLMVPGLHLDMDTFKIETFDAFGEIYLKELKSSKKLLGKGTKFFWAQCLMGDAADTIQGLPKMPGMYWQEYAGTQAYKDLMEKWRNETYPEKAEKLWARITKLEEKPKLCGPALTYEVLKTAGNDKECYLFVKDCYQKLASVHGHEFKHWKTGSTVTPTQALLSEMQLLWMRRYKDPMDVVKWLKEEVMT